MIHPLLVAVFPTLFLYARNVREMSAGQILVPIAAWIVAAIILWVIFGMLLRDVSKGALIASICVFALSTYGHLFSLLGSQHAVPTTHVFLVPTIVVAIGACCYFAWRARGNLGNLTRAVNVAAAVVIAVNVFNIASYKIHVAATESASARAATPAPTASSETYAWVKPTSDGPSQTTAPGASQTSPSAFGAEASLGDNSTSVARKKVPAKPDIYLIVLDEYAGSGTMQRIYGYDNGDFTSNLEEMGFFVAPDSKMHNYMTSRAVASILNMEYTPESEPTDVTIDRIMHNEVVSYLHSKGYTYVYFGQLYEQCPQRAESADLYFNYYEAADQVPVSIPFLDILRQTTILSTLDDSLASEHDAQLLREAYLKTVDHLAQMPAMDGPKFVYAHIMAAHTPYVFGPNGEDVSRDSGEREAYLGQYVFTTKVIQKVIEQLLADSAEEPIVIVQSDHGPRWSGDWNDILNAYYLPGNVDKTLPSDISPVNTFRLIFNKYLGGNFGLLENK